MPLSIFNKNKTEQPDVDSGVDTDSISLDLDPVEEQEEIVEDGADQDDFFPAEFDTDTLDPENARTIRHPVESGWFRVIVVGLGVSIGLGFAIFYWNFASNKKFVKKTPEVKVEQQDPVALNQRSEKVTNALSLQEQRREQTAARLAEEDRERLKNQRKGIKPARPTPTARRTTPARTTPVRIRPSRVPTPARAPAPRPISRPAPRPAPRPRPPIVAAKPAPTPKPIPQPSTPLDRSPSFGGSLPTDQSSPAPSETGTQFVSDNPAPILDPLLGQQQQAVLQGKSILPIPGGSVIQAEITSEWLAREGATFKAVTAKEAHGIPQGTEVLAQITRLDAGGHFESEVIAINGQQLAAGSTRMTKSNGKLLKAKGGESKGGFFQSEFGQLVTGTIKDAGTSFIEDQVGGNRTVRNGLNEIIVLGDSSGNSSRRTTEEDTPSPTLIKKGSVSISFTRDTYVSR